MFKEFLDQKASKDEVFFYLYCRDAISGGPVMRNGDNFFEIVDYVQWNIAE